MADRHVLTTEEEALVQRWKQLPDQELRQIKAAIRLLLGQDPAQYEDDPAIIEAANVGVALYGLGGVLR